MSTISRHLILHSDVVAGLDYLADNSVDLAVTSPPYWGQRNYGFEGQIGVEAHYKEYISKLVAIFNLLRQKLSRRGVFFLNIGDKYISKYGKSPLGMIPFRLADAMLKEGWFLNDILIWYKPNHMPTSIKNRFANSYEPIFAFSRSDQNIFSRHRDSDPDYTNILKVSLQSTPYKHIAVYPEKLIEMLFDYVCLSDHCVILDPFAGSGTTLKAVLNRALPNRTVMIEKHGEYIDIIRERCRLSDYSVIELPFKPYPYKKHPPEQQISLFDVPLDYVIEHQIDPRGFIKITDQRDHLSDWLKLFKNRRLKSYLQPDALCFLGGREFDIGSIIAVVNVQQYGWIIRNMIVVDDKGTWFPLFMLVDDNKRVRYRFNYQRLQLKSKTEEKGRWDRIDFRGYPVKDSLSKEHRAGTVVKIIESYANRFPKYILVAWDDSTVTREFVIFDEDEINDNLVINREDGDKFIRITERQEIIPLEKVERKTGGYSNIGNQQPNGKKNYNGKYTEIERYNWGASPGARAAVESEYFSLRRLYDVDQALICDYLNYKRRRQGLSKKGLTNLFPPEYRHTVGHWLRKDFGGSLPSIKDWFTLQELLDIESDVTNYVCKTGLKLQTVRNSTYKVPDDFMSVADLARLNKLIE